MAEKHRDVLDQECLFTKPPRPPDTSRRARSRWNRELEPKARVCRALAALQMSLAGRLDDRLMNGIEPWARRANADMWEWQLSDRVPREVERTAAPPSVPRTRAALARLGAGAPGETAPQDSRASFLQKAAELTRTRRAGEGQLPERGAGFAALWSAAALPPAGLKPVDVRTIFLRAARTLDDMKNQMIGGDGDEKARESKLVS